MKTQWKTPHLKALSVDRTLSGPLVFDVEARDKDCQPIAGPGGQEPS